MLLVEPGYDCVVVGGAKAMTVCVVGGAKAMIVCVVCGARP